MIENGVGWGIIFEYVCNQHIANIKTLCQEVLVPTRAGIAKLCNWFTTSQSTLPISFDRYITIFVRAIYMHNIQCTKISSLSTGGVWRPTRPEGGNRFSSAWGWSRRGVVWYIDRDLALGRLSPLVLSVGCVCWSSLWRLAIGEIDVCLHLCWSGIRGGQAWCIGPLSSVFLLRSLAIWCVCLAMHVRPPPISWSKLVDSLYHKEIPYIRLDFSACAIMESVGTCAIKSCKSSHTHHHEWVTYMQNIHSGNLKS